MKAPIIVEDGFGEDYGGGISQLTTTLFNAVFFGGYVDVDHSPHHYYISRYPMGREATIVYPYVDLKFRNDTKHGVLIRATYSATSVTVTFYGNTDGRDRDRGEPQDPAHRADHRPARAVPGEEADRRPEQRVRHAHRVRARDHARPARPATTWSSTG